jgi:hypothetical protein
MGREHGLYVGDALSLSVIGSLFCGTPYGHDLKSRAQSTTVQNSQIYDGAAGPAPCNAATTSLGIDTPNGGQVTLDHDLIVQDGHSVNSVMVSYGEDGLYLGSSFAVSDTNFSSSGLSDAVGIQVRPADCPVVKVQLSNDSFTGITTPVTPGCSVTTVSEPGSFMLLSCALTGLFLVRRRPNGLLAFKDSALIFWRRTRNMISHSSLVTAMAQHSRATGERTAPTRGDILPNVVPA